MTYHSHKVSQALMDLFPNIGLQKHKMWARGKRGRGGGRGGEGEMERGSGREGESERQQDEGRGRGGREGEVGEVGGRHILILFSFSSLSLLLLRKTPEE